jgi:glycosyltransferase involved in cell wall biosynthesis
MTNTPLVAIITRTKNRNILLERCIKTVLAQTEEDFLHVIVNDGGDDQAVDQLVARYRDQYRGRLLLIHNKTSVGMEAASNVGIKSSQSKYVTILDDDDSWHPTFLQRSIRALESDGWPATKGIFCHTEIVYEKIDGENVIETSRADFNGWMRSITLLDELTVNRFTPVCFLFERAVFEEIGYYDEALPVCGDWEFHIRFLAAYDIAILPQTLAFWHQRPQISNGTYGNSVHSGQDLHQLYRARLINRWVRSSMKEGHLSLGDAFAMAQSIEHGRTIENMLNRMRDRAPFRRFKRALKKLGSALVPSN